jgi:hypothetical protein
VQRFAAFFQTPGSEQPEQPKNMVAMKVADKYVAAMVNPDAMPEHLHLRALATIDQKNLFVHVERLCGIMPPVKRAARPVA